jgi:hypothetical protein
MVGGRFLCAVHLARIQRLEQLPICGARMDAACRVGYTASPLRQIDSAFPPALLGRVRDLRYRYCDLVLSGGSITVAQIE